MLIRVFDRENSRYYKSIVYGVVNHLSDAIVLNPYTDCFELSPHFDTSAVLYEPLYEEIQPEVTGLWNLDFAVPRVRMPVSMVPEQP